jgi:AAA domain
VSAHINCQIFLSYPQEKNMTFQFAPAKREHVSLLIALAGASGSGKTYSALRLANGLAAGGKIAFIDTEARRGLHYAEDFQFIHADMRPPFTPAAFIYAIHEAEKAGAAVVIIDSFSHEYDGEGGIIDHADRLASEGVKSPGNWKEPKLAHKKLMNALLQCRASIIFCLRADEKIEILRENNKTVVRPLGWMPICEKRFMFEMTASFTLTPDRPGIPHFDLPHKLQRQHRAMFTDTQPISEESGRLLAEWASGGSAAPATPAGHAGAADGAPELTVTEWDVKLGEEAKKGMKALQDCWATVPRQHQTMLKAALDRRHKLTAEKVPA